MLPVLYCTICYLPIYLCPYCCAGLRGAQADCVQPLRAPGIHTIHTPNYLICANCLDLTCSCGAGEAVREGHQRGEREGAHREALQPALAANEQGGAAHLPTLGGLTVRWHVMYVTSQLIGLLKYYTTICNYFKLISGYGI